MNVKDLFAKGENGVLTYDQFKKLAEEAKAKFVDLGEGNYVDKNKYTDDLATKEKQIESLKGDITKRDGDLAGLQEKLKNAGSDVEKLSQVSTELTNLQGKYDQDMKNYQEQLAAQAYEFAVKDFANSKEFTSNAAKRDFIAEMTAKKLTLENGKIMGAEDFAGEYAKANADAFKVADPNAAAGQGGQPGQQQPAVTPNQNEPKPQFVGSTPGGEPGDKGGQVFDFQFTGVRPHEQKN